MKTRTLGILLLLAILSTLFTSAAAENGNAYQTYSFDILRISLPAELPVFTRENILENSNVGKPLLETERQRFKEQPDLYLDSLYPKEGIVLSVTVEPSENEMDFSRIEGTDAQSELLEQYRPYFERQEYELLGLGCERLSSGLYICAYAAGNDPAGLNDIYQYYTQIESGGAHYKVMIGIETNGRVLTFEGLSYLKDAMDTVVLAGKGNGSGNWRERDTVLAFENGYMVSFQLPAGWEERPRDLQDDALAGTWGAGSTETGKYYFMLKYVDIWSHMSFEERISFGADTRDEMMMEEDSALSEALQSKIKSYPEYGEFAGYSYINGICYMTYIYDMDQKPEESIYSVNRIVYYVTTYRGVFHNFAFAFTGTAMDMDVATSIMNTVLFLNESSEQ